MTDITHALATKDQPNATYKALESLVHETVGIKLFTLMKIDRTRGVARRTFSNQPCLLYTSPSPRDATLSRMPSSA